MERLLPVIDDLNRYYWEAAKARRLDMLRCQDCRMWIHPPRESCAKCQSFELKAETLSGRGKVYSWSVMRTQGNPGFEEKLPYAVVVVELEEQKGLITVGNIDCPIEDIDIGLPVRVTFEKINDQVTLPQWTVAGGKDGQ